MSFGGEAFAAKSSGHTRRISPSSVLHVEASTLSNIVFSSSQWLSREAIDRSPGA